jgi:hypothetical protein
MIELGPNDPIPEGVATIFRGTETETPDSVRPEDTFDTGGSFVPDGRHLYGDETQLVRPIITQSYVNEANARAIARGHSPVFISWDEVPKFKPRAPLVKRMLGRLGIELG